MRQKFWSGIEKFKSLAISILVMYSIQAQALFSETKNAFREIRNSIWYQNKDVNNDILDIQQHGVRFSIALPKSLYFVNHPETVEQFVENTGLNARAPKKISSKHLLLSGFYGQEMLHLKINRQTEIDEPTAINQGTKTIQLTQHTDTFNYYTTSMFSDFYVLPYSHFQNLNALNLNATHRHTCRIYQMKHKSGTKQPFLFMKIRVLFSNSCTLDIRYFNTSINWDSALKYAKIIQSVELIEIVDLEYVVDEDIKVLSYN
jgi:hypothetical protein